MPETLSARSSTRSAAAVVAGFPAGALPEGTGVASGEEQYEMKTTAA